MADTDLATKEKMLDNTPLAVTVVIPIYNSEKWIDDLLCSLRNQTLSNIEVLCIDDGSTDKSSEIIKRHCAHDSRIQYFYQENAGAASARNHGMRLAQGDYIIFCDSDDLLEAEMLEAMYQGCVRSCAEVCICGATMFHTVTGAKKDMHCIGRYAKNGLNHTLSLSKHLFQSFQPGPWNKLFKRTFILENKLEFQDLPCVNDLYFAYSAIAKSTSIYVIREPLINYRYGSGISLQDAYFRTPECGLEARSALRKDIINKDTKRSLDTLSVGALGGLSMPSDIESFRKLHGVYEKALREWDLYNAKLSHFVTFRSAFLLYCYRRASLEGLYWAYEPIRAQRVNGFFARANCFLRRFLVSLFRK